MNPASYAADLKQSRRRSRGAEERVKRIRKALDAACRTVAGARWREDQELLETVVNLTEFPSVILGNFEREFLSLPEEVLVTVMRDHQKYFAVEDASGKLAPHFLAVLNTDGDPQRNHPARARARAAGALQRRALLLDGRPEASAARAGGVAEERHLPERPRQLLRQDACGCRSWPARLSQTLEDAGVKVRPGIAAQGRIAGQDRPDHRAGEGIHRAAGDCRRAVRQGAGACDPAPSATPSTTSTSRSPWKTRRRGRWRARCSRSPTRPIRLPECSRWD